MSTIVRLLRSVRPVQPVVRFASTLVRLVGGLLPIGLADPPDDDEIARARVRVQVQLIRDALGPDDVAVCVDGATGGKTSDDAYVEYLFRPGHVLVLTERLPQLDLFFTDSDYSHLYGPGGGPVREPVPGVTLYRLPPAAHGPAGEPADVLDSLRDINDWAKKVGIDADPDDGVDAARLKKLLATPDHILFVTPNDGHPGHLCPATEPLEVDGVPAPVPPAVTDVRVGNGVGVSVVDTGWDATAKDNQHSPWVAAKVGGEAETHDPKKNLRPYQGHGTFVAGIVHCLAPGSEVRVEALLPNGGAVHESDITQQLHDAELKDLDIISVSAGSATYLDAGMLAVHTLAELDDWMGDGPLIVAAAGNNSTDRPFFPAAFTCVVAVGAVEPDGRTLCDFTNYGSWVDVYARGRDLVNAFPTGTYVCYEPPDVGTVRHFSGIAKWSGTSFSTPIVSGMIAAAVAPAGVVVQSARSARDQVLGKGSTVTRTVQHDAQTFDATTFV